MHINATEIHGPFYTSVKLGPMLGRTQIGLGAISACLSVALGAMAAHGLKERLSPYHLDIFKTAAHYQMVHALALILIGILATTRPAPGWIRAGWAMLVGTVLFSGSLYLLAVTDVRWLGAITPFGGVAFMAGWLLLAWGAFRVR